MPTQITEWSTALMTSLAAAMGLFFSAIPKVLGFLIILIVGWLIGGTVGIGTVLFALLIGPFVGYGLMLVGRVAGTGGSAPTDSDPALEA